MDRFTQVSNESWFSRLGGSIKNIFGGILLILGAITLLWWNEGRAVKTAKGLEEGADNVVVLDDPILDDENNNKLIHFQGEMISEDSLYDEEFNIAVMGIKLKREVEMYQWKEETKTTKKKKVRGGEKKTTEYEYKKVWSSELISSHNFEYPKGHENPADFSYDNLTDVADNVFLGDFTMTSDILGQVSDYETIKLDNDNLPNNNGALVKEAVNDQTAYKIYLGKGTKSNPQVGDVKISFYEIPNGEYSIIAKQEGGALKSYTTATDTEILMVSSGRVSAKEMFESAMKANTILTWVLRFAGLLIMFLGFTAMGSIFETIADVIPILGSIVGLGIKLFAGVTSFLISTLIIGIAWIYYRPLLGGIIIAIGLVIALFFYKKSLDKKSV